jgi:hypothetical protein
MVQGGYYCVELVLIGLLSCVKLDDSSLEDGDEVVEQVVVGLLLLAGSET